MVTIYTLHVPESVECHELEGLKGLKALSDLNSRFALQKVQERLEKVARAAHVNTAPIAQGSAHKSGGLKAEVSATAAYNEM